MGKQHLQEMQRAGMTPVAVAELDPARLLVAEEDFPGISSYTSVAKMLQQSDVQLLAIITPHNTHAKLALQCLKAGRHVVCEKPLAITTAECDSMIAVAKAQQVVLSTYHNRHWDGNIMQAVRQIKQEKVIGDVVRIEAHMGSFHQPSDWWRTSKTISGGIMYDWGVHLLEYSLQLIDGEITEVSGFAKHGIWASKTAWKDDSNEDEGFAVVRFNNGVWLTLLITQIDAKPKAGMLEITGSKGTYVMDGNHYELYLPGDPSTITKGHVQDSEGWRFYQNIADHLLEQAPLVITPEWARRPIHVLDLAAKSAQQGHSLRAKYR
jgi:predicted dehydrogenase